MSNRVKRKIEQASKLSPAQELVQLKAWQYEATVQVELWVARGRQLHAAIVEREGQPKPMVMAPPV